MGQPDTELTWTWFGPQTRQNHILTPAFKLVTWLNKGNPKPEPDHNLIQNPIRLTKYPIKSHLFMADPNSIIVL